MQDILEPDINDLDPCMEIYDSILSEYYKRKDKSFRTLLFLYLLRHGIISKIQTHDLIPDDDHHNIDNRVTSYVSKGYIKRVKNSNFYALFLTPSGRRMSVELFCDTYRLCSASKDLSSPVSFLTSFGKCEYQIPYVAAVIAKFSSASEKELHHSSASRDLYIYLLKTGIPFSFQPECYFSSGELVAAETKKSLRRFSHEADLKADGVYSLSPLSPLPDRVILEQDTSHQSLGVLRNKALTYYVGVLKYQLYYPGVVDYTLVYSVSNPTSIQTTKLTYAEAQTAREIRKLSLVVEAASGLEPRSLTLISLGKVIAATSDRSLDGLGSALSRLLTDEKNASALCYDAERLFENGSGKRTVRDSLKRRDNIYSMLTKDDKELSILLGAYERGFSLAVLSNSHPEDISAVRLSVGSLGSDVLFYHFHTQVAYTYEPYHEYEITVGVERRPVVFRNVFHAAKGDICIENIDLDLGARHRAKIYSSGKCKDMTLICISSERNAEYCLQVLEASKGSGSGAYFTSYSHKGSGDMCSHFKVNMTTRKI